MINIGSFFSSYCQWVDFDIFVIINSRWRPKWRGKWRHIWLKCSLENNYLPILTNNGSFSFFNKIQFAKELFSQILQIIVHSFCLSVKECVLILSLSSFSIQYWRKNSGKMTSYLTKMQFAKELFIRFLQMIVQFLRINIRESVLGMTLNCIHRCLAIWCLRQRLGPLAYNSGCVRKGIRHKIRSRIAMMIQKQQNVVLRHRQTTANP